MASWALVFPGQGAQHVGMGRDVAESSPRARAIFDQANEVLGYDLAGVCFEGPGEQLEQTDVQQPAIFVTSVALWEACLEAGARREAFAFTAGLSLGEYTALFVAGALDFEPALKLVQERGRLMQAAALAKPGGMVSLVGASVEQATSLCERARGDDVLAPANINCPGQVVLSGSRTACERAAQLAETMGLRALALRVAGAFHSSLMHSAADGLWKVLQATAVRQPGMPVLANVDAAYHGGPDAVRASLRRQVTEPVLWQRCVERMIADGAETFVEVGPGRVLSGLLRKIDRTREAINVNSAESLKSAIERFTRPQAAQVAHGEAQR